MSLVGLSRWQFAITVMFHMTFPAITVGLSIFLCAIYGMYWRSGKAVYLQMFRFWRRIFAVGFAIGVVAGVVITFELGLNRGVYAADTGPILGPILGMEVVTAFAVEAGFVGVLLYGDGRVRRGTMFVDTVMVCIGTILSSTWIIAANSWMRTPAGYQVVNGRYEPTNWLAVIFNPSFVWRWWHMVGGVLLSAGFVVAGISAWYLRKGRATPFARRSMSIGLGVAAIVIPVQIYLGDAIAGHELPPQPSKLAALEGNWSNGNTGRLIFDIPDQQAARNILELNVPCFGSVVQHNLSCTTAAPGLATIPAADRPNMAATFWGFQVMFFASLFMFVDTTGTHVVEAARRLLPRAVLVLATHEPPDTLEPTAPLD